MRNSAKLAGRMAGDNGIEDHDALAARLKRAHGRKYSLWQLLAEE